MPRDAPAGAAPDAYRPLVEVWRGPLVESIHHGAVVVADDEGRVLLAHGSPRIATFLRSSAKPVQALPLLASGAAERFGFDDRQIAVMIGSHGGEPFHVETVRSILARIGLDEEALRCGAHPPYYRPAAEALRAAGTPPAAIHNNCSGKHAGMLALAVALGAPVDSYLEETHPAQRRIREAVSLLSGVPPSEIATAVDGCSAPTFALPLQAAAALYARLLAPGRLEEPWGRAARRATEAMRRHPEMVAGTGRLCTVLMERGRLGLVAKIGAEGFYGFGFVEGGRGRGVALKIADGEGERSRPAAAIAALETLGLLDAEAATDLRDRFVPLLRNRRGLEVGRVVATLSLAKPD